MVEVRVRRVRELPPDIEALVQPSISEDFGAVARLRDDWLGGVNRFDADGEALYEARSDRLVGIGGLNVDPYVGEPSVGRLRHLYVDPAARRCGVASAILIRVVECAAGRFDVLRLRTYRQDAAAFYAARGFQMVPDAHDHTHVLDLGGVAPADPIRDAS